MLALTRGDLAVAIERAEAALALRPDNYEALQVRTLATLHSGRAAEALPGADRLAALYADDAFAHNTRGAVLQMLGRLEEAAAAFRRAAALAPQYAEASLNLARADAQIAITRLQASDFDAALPPAREAARLAPSAPEALVLAANAELQAGSLEACLEALAGARALAPSAALRFTAAIAWPPIMESREQIAVRRAEVEASLDELIADPRPIADPAREVDRTGFYMAYQGFDDTQLQGKIALAYAAACPALEWTAPHVGRARAPRKRIRLGILSRHLSDHTIGKLNIGLAMKLARARFEVVVLRPPAPPDTLSRAFDQAADAVVTLPADLHGARLKVAEAELDALFHPDVGMDPFTYYLAFARLAPVQFTTWGHPVTTGMRNMDYFLSSRHAEPPGAERFYSEKLARFESLPSYYFTPRAPSSFDVRAAAGLAPGERLYACPQTLYKMHPDLDDALALLLARDARARIVMIAARHAAWNERLRRRFERAAGDAARRIVFIPAVSLSDYLALLRDADALLDTFHFGGGSSSYEALAMGAPVVTLPGATMRARITAAWYGVMGQSRWIARSPEHFVDLAIELAGDTARRGEWRGEVRAGAAKILENDAVVRELEAFVEKAVAEPQ
jgi:predicted O-linked N-acetylglucosamine transferase (SPINDLY family)